LWGTSGNAQELMPGWPLPGALVMVSRIYPIHTLESGTLSVQVIKYGSGF